MKRTFSRGRLDEFIGALEFIYNIDNRDEIVNKVIETYLKFIKEDYQRQYQGANKGLNDFIEQKDDDVKIIWGDCLSVMKRMKSESIHCMVTSPPYYNARDYSCWDNLGDYFIDMRRIIRESYRVLDNHRVFVFNIGDIFDNDNLVTKSVWGKRRLPLGAYFIKIFEEEGFSFVDDFIWDKGEVQSERHKSGDKPYPFYQYPANCYEHILVFHKHRLDDTRYPCPICGTLKVNGNTQSEIGLRSWECKNLECFKRSKSNRGKRFSLKTLMTQSHQHTEHEIPQNFIKKWRKDIVKFSPVIKINSKGKNTLGHTAPFPEDIPEFAIRMFTYQGERVLDPFGGSFTSVIVAKKLGRIGIGIELNKKLFREASLKNIHKCLPPTLFNSKSIEITEYDFEKE
ncbi:MAG: site-specific DNA-methyltransferase [Candidatus Hatepunaea meridiana]|nr:site-specific DNA-methyltransferase [Candidatus Hatepunaea meridiana]